MRKLGAAFIYLSPLIILVQCTTIKSMYSGDRNAYTPYRSAWIKKTSHWLTENDRLSFHNTSLQFDRWKVILKRFNIKTVYLFAGQRKSTYESYVSQGLYKLCKRLRKEGFTVWANFYTEGWYEAPANIVEFKVLARRFEIDNRKTGYCFKGLHFDVDDTQITHAQRVQIKDIISRLKTPLSMRAGASVLTEFKPMLSEAILLENGPTKPHATSQRLIERTQLNLMQRDMTALDLDEIEDRLSNLDENASKSSGAAIYTMEQLMKKFDKEEPPLRMSH